MYVIRQRIDICSLSTSVPPYYAHNDFIVAWAKIVTALPSWTTMSSLVLPLHLVWVWAINSCWSTVLGCASECPGNHFNLSALMNVLALRSSENRWKTKCVSLMHHTVLIRFIWACTHLSLHVDSKQFLSPSGKLSWAPLTPHTHTSSQTHSHGPGHRPPFAPILIAPFANLSCHSHFVFNYGLLLSPQQTLSCLYFWS